MRYESVVEEWKVKERDDLAGLKKSILGKDYLLYNLSYNPDQDLDYEKLHSDCQLCIYKQINKYKDHTNKNEMVGNKFLVTCKGIPQKYISDEVFATLGVDPESEEAKSFLSTKDPVAWAYLNCYTEDGEQWIARRHQEVMLRCSSNRIVFRAGRRCLVEGTLVATPKGPKKIEALKVGDTVYGYNSKTNSTFETPVEEVWDQGIQEVVNLNYRNKTIATCTKDHRWHTETEKGFRSVKRVHQFYKGMGISRRFIEAPLGSANEPHAYAIGAFLGDGCSKEKGSKLYISTADEEVVEKVSKILDCEYKKQSTHTYTWALGNVWGRNNPTKETVNCNHYDSWCKDLYAHEKKVDLDIIKTWNRESCLEFLAGLLDTDGSVCRVGNQLKIDWTMQSRSVLEAVRYLILALFQIELDIKEDDRADKYVNGKVYYLTTKNNLYSKIILRDLDKYIVVDHKKYKAEYNSLPENTKKDAIQVKASKNISFKQCYDISIGTEDNLYLLANGLVTHNTGKSDALIIGTLFESIVLPNSKIIRGEDGKLKKKAIHTLIITPRQTHSDNLWKKLETNIKHSEVIREALDGKPKRYPYIVVKFKNGSAITIMTAGTGTAAAGLSIRSFSADRVILDEGNYLGESELKAARAILATREDCRLIVSSTPIGVQDFFYKYCMGSPRYKEFHFPTPLLEHWHTIEEGIYEDCQTMDEFLHEYMAIFSPPGAAVFRMDLVDLAKAAYRYGDVEWNSEWSYSIGVDWNSKAGTEIMVTGYNPHENRYLVVDSINVPKSEWTQLNACNILIETYRKWKAKVVCVDEGYGHTQIELLKSFALNSKDPFDHQLLDALIAFNFSSSIEVRDPKQMGKTNKKPAKPFLVRTAVSRFEAEDITISSEDTLLLQQLNAYQIKSISNLGSPTYHVPDDDLGDHRLDAFMLSLLGFKLKYDILLNRPPVVIGTGYIKPATVETQSREIKETKVKEKITTRFSVNGVEMNTEKEIKTKSWRKGGTRSSVSFQRGRR